ncbi:MAG: cupredoxin domain-containing protein [Thermoleophilaceae bacterium]
MPLAAKRAGCALLASLAVLALSAPAAGAADAELVSVSAGANGAQRMLYRVGPFRVTPGQNEIGNRIVAEKPAVDGWITRIRPDLVYTNGRVPGVDVIHLHHGVWLNLSRPDTTWPGLPERFFAVGEEKTIFTFPRGYGYEYRASDTWLLNHMIHNLTPVPTEVYMVYEIDFIPRTSPRARGMRPVRPVWMDVENGSAYPVFDVRKGAGSRGRFTYPRDVQRAYAGRGRLNEWVADRDGVLVATAGHLHPGGLHTDLYLQRRGERGRAHLFRSKAKYFEPAGAVSWDVAMTATRPDWRVRVRRGDVLSTTATYASRRAAWWESMGIMVAYMADRGPGRNPFKRRVSFPGRPTHGHLMENDNHGGGPADLPNPLRLRDGVTVGGPLDILDFKFTLGNLGLPGVGGRPPVVRRGQSITFRNVDDPKAVYHSITSCKPPCNRETGIAYPIADGPVQFESGTLGSAVPPATGRLEWRTPRNLDRGTYTYFCRIHPFMRGAFRVK